jgi:hypothetical protein
MAKSQQSFHWANDSLVRIMRSASVDPVDGYIVARGRKWLLVRVVDGSSCLDGYTAIRNEHITEVTDRGTTAQFTRRLLKMQNQWPPTGPSFSIDLDRTAGLVAALSDQDIAVGVYIEEEDPDVIFVGIPFRYKQNILGLNEIDSTGEWRSEASQWNHRRLTRIEFCSRYTIHMLEVAKHLRAVDADGEL